MDTGRAPSRAGLCKCQPSFLEGSESGLGVAVCALIVEKETRTTVEILELLTFQLWGEG